jgi:hypothetical protein
MTAMNTSSSTTSPAEAAHVPEWSLWVRRLYLLIAGLVCLSIVGQVFFAGAAVLVDPTYWATHRTLGNTIELIALALVLIGLATRLPWRIQSLGGLLYVLMLLQYVFLYLMPQIGVPLLRALHAANALSLFGVAAVLVLQVRQQIDKRSSI